MPDATITVVVAVLCGVVGLLVGSFLNVVVWRVPRGESIVSPPSACPRCGARIKPYDNIPVVSWLMLRGRCRNCHEPISARYPLVEAGTGAFFVGVAWWAGPSAVLPAFLYLAAISVALALIDLDTRRLPNAIVLPAYPVALVLLAVASWAQDDWTALGRGAVGGAALYAFYFALMVLRPGGMGFGDVKLAGVLGLYLGWLGWSSVVVGAFGAFLIGGIVSIGLLLARRAGRKSAIPFGPFMLVGAWIGIFAGEAIGSGYLSLLG